MKEKGKGNNQLEGHISFWWVLYKEQAVACCGGESSVRWEFCKLSQGDRRAVGHHLFSLKNGFEM